MDAAGLRLVIRRRDHTPAPVDGPLRDRFVSWRIEQPGSFLEEVERGEAADALVATATLPGDLSVTHIGPNHVTGVVWDELGIEYVRVYRIVRDEGPR